MLSKSVNHSTVGLKEGSSLHGAKSIRYTSQLNNSKTKFRNSNPCGTVLELILLFFYCIFFAVK